jgi:hypothetical protein
MKSLAAKRDPIPGVCPINDDWDMPNPGSIVKKMGTVTLGGCRFEFESRNFLPHPNTTSLREVIGLTKAKAPNATSGCANAGGIIMQNDVIPPPGGPSRWSAAPAGIVGNGDPNDGGVIATMYQRQVQGQGFFMLEARDAKLGGVVRTAKLPWKAPAGGCEDGCNARATSITSKGAQVIVVGESSVTYTGQTGTGRYFKMTWNGFLAPQCTPKTDILPTSIVRSAKPF